tara:strand:+ start:70 stop:1209 length:1140 start_codon:yes stop_codon:yes gene_type:complete
MKTLLISFIFFTLFVSKIFASTISGTYYGKSCGTSCKSDNILADPFEVVNIVTNIFGLSDKNVSFFIDQKNEETISVLFLDKRILFTGVSYDPKLRTFKGVGEKDTITGSFNGENLTISVQPLENKSAGTGKSKYLVKRLTKSKDTFISLENSQENLLQAEDQIEKLKFDLEKTAQKYKVDTEKLNKQIDELNKKLKKPTKINVDLFEATSTVAANVDLLTAPDSKKGKKITTLKEGDLINHLTTIPPDRDWSLVTSSNGLIGYIKNIFIIDNVSVNNTSIPSEPSVNEGDRINLLEPLWDKGKRGEQITLNAPGIVSLQGVINIENLSSVYINDEIVDISNGRFNHAIIVTEGKNNVVISAENTSGKRTESQFIILVN